MIRVYEVTREYGGPERMRGMQAQREYIWLR